jgi:serine acetyltransferase
MKISSRALRLPFSALYKGLGVVVRNVYGIELPYTVRVGRRVIIEHQGSIVVHGNAGIGDDSILRQGVTLGNRRKDRPLDAPQIGRNVNIGAGAKIIGDVIVGDGASIGANSVVTRDVRPGAVMVGIPAAEVRRNGISVTHPATAPRQTGAVRASRPHVEGAGALLGSHSNDAALDAGAREVGARRVRAFRAQRDRVC